MRGKITSMGDYDAQGAHFLGLLAITGNADRNDGTFKLGSDTTGSITRKPQLPPPDRFDTEGKPSISCSCRGALEPTNPTSTDTGDIRADCGPQARGEARCLTCSSAQRRSGGDVCLSTAFYPSVNISIARFSCSAIGWTEESEYEGGPTTCQPPSDPGNGQPSNPGDGGSHSGRCISGNSVQHTLVDGHVASGHQITNITPAPSVAGLDQGWNYSRNDNGDKHGLQIYVSGTYISVEYWVDGVPRCSGNYSNGKPNGWFYNRDSNGEKDGVQYYISGTYWSFETYRAGTQHGPSGNYSNGKPNGWFYNRDSNGEKDGVQYYISGNYWSFETYRAGTQHGRYGT